MRFFNVWMQIENAFYILQVSPQTLRFLKIGSAGRFWYEKQLQGSS